MKVQFTSRANADVEEAATYYRTKSLPAATGFLDAVQGAVRMISGRPLASPKVTDQLRRYVMRKFPYGLFYCVRSDAALIVAVIHAKRDPRVWRGRE